MNDIEHAVEMLNELLRRKINSLASYVLDASPYVAAEDRPIMEAVGALSARARRHAQEAARLVLSLEGVPGRETPEPSIVECNYLSLRYLLGLLLERLDEDIAVWRRFRDQCQVARAREFLEKVVRDDVADREWLERLRQRLRADQATSKPS